MTTWQPITRGKPDMKGENEEHLGYFDVSIALDRVPPEEWMDFFESPVGIGIPSSHLPICLEGSEITFSVPAADLTSYVKFVDAIIKAANNRYAAEVLPKLANEADLRKKSGEM